MLFNINLGIRAPRNVLFNRNLSIRGAHDVLLQFISITVCLLSDHNIIDPNINSILQEI